MSAPVKLPQSLGLTSETLAGPSTTPQPKPVARDRDRRLRGVAAGDALHVAEGLQLLVDRPRHDRLRPDDVHRRRLEPQLAALDEQVARRLRDFVAVDERDRVPAERAPPRGG